MNREEIWRFDTARFSVVAYAEPDLGLDLSWDDDGSARDGIESGKYVAFCACVAVYLDGREIAADYLGGCIYSSCDEFVTGHRDPDPLNRNCSVMRAARGDNVAICHYFPGMVHQAICEARAALAKAGPKMREVA